MHKRLEMLRAEVDALDAQLVRLFEMRLSVCEEIGREKRRANLPTLDPERERAVLAGCRAQVHAPRFAPYAERYLTHVMALCRDCQDEQAKGAR